MEKDDKKIAFIICVNNDVLFEECKFYINHLRVPKGYQIDLLEIRDATSMCAAYNEGMHYSNAKFKVYMHQDVYIRNPDFLQNIIDIFEEDDNIGMIGMVGGTDMPKSGVIYRAWNAGAVDSRDPDMAYFLVRDSKEKQTKPIEAVDGLLIATQYDLEWREDLFFYFDFYDGSQSFEMRRAGYKIFVPEQQVPWVIHDCGFAKLKYYDEGRKCCIQEYSEFLYAEDGYEFLYDKEWNDLSEVLATQIKQMLVQHRWSDVISLIDVYRKGKMQHSDLEMLAILTDIYKKEQNSHVKCGFFEGLYHWDDIYKKYMRMRFMLRRMELQFSQEEYNDFVVDMKNQRISHIALGETLIHSIVDKESCLEKCIEYYKESGDEVAVSYLEQILKKVKEHGIAIVYLGGKK